jgi:hypothetical protein
VSNETPANAVKLPWFLTMSWGWLFAAAIVLSIFAHSVVRLRFPYLDLIFFWPLVQAGWLRSIDRRSYAAYIYSLSLVLGIAFSFAQAYPRTEKILGDMWLASWVLANFVFRYDMLRYFGGRESIMGLLETFAWNTFYFQYQFNKVAKLQRYDSQDIMPAAG